jgi:hypothetical protein
MSQFWQKTQRRLQPLKKTVPLPRHPCTGASSAKWGATVDTSALHPTLHTPSSFSSLCVEDAGRVHVGTVLGGGCVCIALRMFRQPASRGVVAPPCVYTQSVLHEGLCIALLYITGTRVVASAAGHMGAHLFTPQLRGHALQSASSSRAACSLAGMRPRRCVVTAAGT